MKRIMTYGIFDVLYEKDICLLKEARAIGDYLVVCLAGDEFIANYKCEMSRTEEHRKAVLEAIRYVDEVIIYQGEEQLIQEVENQQIELIVVEKCWLEAVECLSKYCKIQLRE